jgi:rubrerythrin
MRMKHWTLNDIEWDRFDRSKVRPELLAVVKAGSMVEYNGYDYARYLCEVFHDDMEFCAVANEWAVEEVQHGAALRKWAEMADPAFDFPKSFAMFTEGYKLPLNVEASVRGSRSGELVARCIVEIGTSSYYTAIMEYTDEPVLQAICAKIAADELRHYKLFYTYLKRYLEKENIGVLKRFMVALGRITESEDDELAYAFFAAQCNGVAGKTYERKASTNRYFACACLLYRRRHIEKMTAMVFKAVGLKPHTRLNGLFTHAAWAAMRLKNYRLRSYSKRALAGVF